MANFKFWTDRTDKRVRNSDFNNFVMSNRNCVISGCEVTGAGVDMDVDIASGSVLVDGVVVSVSAGSVTLSASDPSHDRYDLIVVNASGTLSAITGTAATPPTTPTYAEETYTVLAGVLIQDGVTTLSSSDVQNIGIENSAFSKHNSGTSDPASGAVGELFYNTTSSTLKTWNGSAWASIGGSDSDAIHDNVAGEINAITEKATPISADLVLIEDSADSNNKKKVQVGNLPSTDSDAIHDNVAGEINAITEKTNPVSADLILIEDSADSNNKKKLQVGNLSTTDSDAIHDNVAGEINAVSEKTSPVAADLFLIEDSADSNNKKKVQLSNLGITGKKGQAVTVAYTAMSGNASVTLFSLPAKSVVTDMHVSVTSAFDAGTSTEIGITGDETMFTPAFDLDTTGLKEEPYSTDNEMLSTSSATDIKMFGLASGWSSGGNLNTARSNLAAAGTSSATLSFGGTNGTTPQNATEEYDGSSWSSGGNLNTARYYLGGCGTQTAGLSFCGYTTLNVTTTEEYNGTSWSGGGAYASDYHGVAGCGTQTAGLCFGGYRSSAQSQCAEYNGTSWSAGGSLSGARNYHAGSGVQTAGLAIAGYNAGNLSTCEEYNGTSWSSGGAVNTARNGLAACGVQTASLCFGGGGSSTVTESYNGTSWTTADSLNTGRTNLAGAGTVSSGLSIGGDTGSVTAVTEEYSSAGLGSWGTLTSGSITIYYSYESY